MEYHTKKGIEVQEMLDKQPSEIEKAYPEAYRLARLFHELYEEYAPMFGYITNEASREFDPASKNGRLMAYVCYNIVHDELENWQDAYRRQGAAANKQSNENLRKYFDAVVEVALRHPLFWEAIYKKVNGKEIERGLTGVATNKNTINTPPNHP